MKPGIEIRRMNQFASSGINRIKKTIIIGA